MVVQSDPRTEYKETMQNIAIDLARPENLSPEGNAAYDTILSFLKEIDLMYTGGCKVFYSPEEWKERGEQYGTKSHLVVVYDGGAHGQAFSLDHAAPSYVHHEAMRDRLGEIGLYTEECTTWYCAVYSDR